MCEPEVQIGNSGQITSSKGGKRWVRKPCAPSAAASCAPTGTAPIASPEPAANVRKNSSPKMMKTIKS